MIFGLTSMIANQKKRITMNKVKEYTYNKLINLSLRVYKWSSAKRWEIIKHRYEYTGTNK